MPPVHYGNPLTVIGFSKEEADKLMAQDPMNTFTLTPKGGIRELPDAGPFLEMSSAVMVMSSARMSQEVGYRIVKAVYEGRAPRSTRPTRPPKGSTRSRTRSSRRRT